MKIRKCQKIVVHLHPNWKTRLKDCSLKPLNEYHIRIEEFDIQFTGLQNHTYTFTYFINSAFLHLFEYAPLDDCDVEVQLQFTKKPTLFILDFALSGTIKIECDRFLAQADLPIKKQYQVFVKMVGASAEKSDRELDVIFILPDETHINVAQLIYEFVVLSVPGKRIPCITLKDKSICDREVLEKWQKLNQSEDTQNTATDPRWDALKKLKENDKK